MGAASMTPVPAVLGHGRATPTWEDTHSQSPGPPRPQSHFRGGGSCVLRCPSATREAALRAETRRTRPHIFAPTRPCDFSLPEQGDPCGPCTGADAPCGPGATHVPGGRVLST